MKYILLELLKKDGCVYEDERLASNLYLCSLSTSCREMYKIQKKLEEIQDKDSPLYKRQKENFDNKQEENNWLLQYSNKVKCIAAINYDVIPQLCNVDNAQSVDALIVDYCNSRCFLIEFKNCSKKTLIDKYISGKDSILNKLITSKNILKNLEINEFSQDEIIRKTEVMVVYNKNDLPSYINSHIPKKRISSKDENGKQNQATMYGKNKVGSACRHSFKMSKGTDDSLNRFKKEIINLGYAQNSSFDKSKKSDVLLGALDFVKLAEGDFFDSIDWGIYKAFLDT